MSANQWGVNIEINGGDIIAAMIEDLGIDELVEFVEELVDTVADGDLTNELYELMRNKHEDWLEAMGVDECEYQSDYAGPGIYDGIEASIAEDDLDDEDDEDDEHWTTDDDDVFREENPMDVFTTEDK